MQIFFEPYSLKFKHPFGISLVTRTETKVVYIEIKEGFHVGYGEAALPPYLKETQESVINFFRKIDPEKLEKQNTLESALNYIDSIEEGNYAAKGAIDIALHDLYGKKLNMPLHKLWNLPETNLPPALFTIGVSDDEYVINEKLESSKYFSILKLKVNNDSPLEQVKKLRKLTNKKICVDANQSWSDKEKSLTWIGEMKDEGVIFVEQPFEKKNLDNLLWLSERSSLPVFADESFQTIDDLDTIKNCCHGINIKLMKCGGLQKARLIISKARQYNLKIIMGCMSESSCGIAAAAQLTPLVDYADLDGPLLITNDPFEGVHYQDGKIILRDSPGIGTKKLQNK